jgi:sugar phosphate isomerase/epimerase
MGAMALSLPRIPGFFKSSPMGIVVYSFSRRFNPKMENENYPMFTDAIDLLEHCHEIGAGGIQTGVNDWNKEFSKKFRARKEKLGMYFEGSIRLPGDSEEIKRFEQEIITAKEAGANILRTVCLGGRRYETFHSEQEFQDFKKKSIESIQLAEPVVRKHKIKLAVENHKDWRAPELVTILKQLDSEWLGATLDFGNNIAMMEDPMQVVETLAPYIFSTHIKDMAVEEYQDGFLLSEVPLGQGILNLPKIVSICKQHNPEVTFNLEMITRDPLEIPCLTDEYWSTFNEIPGSDLAATLRMVRQNKYKTSLPKYSHLSPEEQILKEEQNVVSSIEYSKTKLGLV